LGILGRREEGRAQAAMKELNFGKPLYDIAL
jgi:hypothetical protein